MMRKMQVVTKAGKVHIVQIWAPSPDLHNMRIVVDRALQRMKMSLTDVRTVRLMTN